MKLLTLWITYQSIKLTEIGSELNSRVIYTFGLDFNTTFYKSRNNWTQADHYSFWCPSIKSKLLLRESQFCSLISDQRLQIDFEWGLWFVWYFPVYRFGCASFNKAKIYKWFKLQFPSIWKNIQKNLNLRRVSKNNYLIFNDVIILTIKYYYDFHLKASCQRSLSWCLQSKCTISGFLNFDFLTERADIAYGEADLIEFIGLCVDKVDFLLRKLEDLLSCGIN